uniref:Uncharacterized protein n=1 Tax=viral metagenome TaxID=1070528 RepID=A0A6H1ZX75_9ZZZZ
MEEKKEFKKINMKPKEVILVEPQQIMALIELPENFSIEFNEYNYKEVNENDFLFRQNTKGKNNYRLINKEDNTLFPEEFVKTAIKIIELMDLEDNIKYYYNPLNPLIVLIENQAKQTAFAIAPRIEGD